MCSFVGQYPPIFGRLTIGKLGSSYRTVNQITLTLEKSWRGERKAGEENRDLAGPPLAPVGGVASATAAAQETHGYEDCQEAGQRAEK